MLLLYNAAYTNTARSDEQLKTNLRRKQGSPNGIQGLVFLDPQKSGELEEFPFRLLADYQ